MPHAQAYNFWADLVLPCLRISTCGVTAIIAGFLFVALWDRQLLYNFLFRTTCSHMTLVWWSILYAKNVILSLSISNRNFAISVFTWFTISYVIAIFLVVDLKKLILTLQQNYSSDYLQNYLVTLNVWKLHFNR